jgi:hypothetical protein
MMIYKVEGGENQIWFPGTKKEKLLWTETYESCFYNKFQL